MNWGQILVEVIVGAILGIAGTFFSFQGRISQLEAHITQISQRPATIEANTAQIPGTQTAVTQIAGQSGSNQPEDNPPRVTQSSMPGSFQNFELNNGTPGRGALEDYCRNVWFAPCRFESVRVHAGRRSLRVEVQTHPDSQNGGTVRIFPSRRPIDLSSATIISVWVYDTQGSNTVELKLCNGEKCPEKVWSMMRSTEDDWAQITWSISSFKSVDKHNITGIELYEWNDGIYYFDDVSWQ